jgi:predicted transposase YdaD
LHIEFQLQHQKDFPKRVFVYSAELTNQFEKSVISLALYLERREAPIPESYVVSLGKDVINRFSYPVLKIWDYEEEIRSGKLIELAPLLTMIVKEPTVETLEEERQLILQEKDDKKRGRLLATAVTIASRYFERDFLWQFFREEVQQMHEVPFISDWIREGRQEGRQEGLQEGLQKGYVQACREDIISLLEDKFGVVKKNILDYLDKVERVESLRMLLKRVSKVETQEEFLDLIKIAVGE